MNAIYGVQRGGDMGSCWAQHWSKVQYNDEARYVPRRGVIDAVWDEIYTRTISESKRMYDFAGEEGNTNLQGVALVMQAVGFQTLVELFGPIPFKEAVTNGIVQPAYDDDVAVFNSVIEMLTQADSVLASGKGTVTATSDLFYGGDISKWRKLANSLKFRALMRISSSKDVSTELKSLITANNMFTSSSDDAQLIYAESDPDANPIYETIVFGNRTEYKINSVLVETLESLDDPRLDSLAAPNDSGVILGKPSGYGNQTTLPNNDLGYTYSNISGLGDFYLDPKLPGVLLSYSQLNFLIAEAANEGFIDGGINLATTHYNIGITANFEKYGLSPGAYLSSVSFSTKEDARIKIGTQQWIALFGQGFESWTEWRRTNVPALTPAIEGAFNQIPGRLYYSSLEPSLNKDNYTNAVSKIGEDKLTSKLFWNK